MAVAVAAILALGACQDSIPPVRTRPIGLFTINVDGDARPDSTSPSAAFFRAQGVDLLDSRFASDQCAIRGYSADAGQGNSFPGVNAGEALEVELASGKRQLVPSESPSGRLYTLPTGQLLGITPGEIATLRVPGDAAGFPATTVTIETVKPFDFQPIPEPAVGGDVDVTWSGGGSVSSAMVLSLRYQSQAQSAVQSQVICILVDDGTHTIPAEVLGEWRNPLTKNRSAAATRLRTSAATLTGSDAVMYALSSYTKAVTVTVTP
ncbi:MAG: hypothetical protein ACJ79S_10955 [Gemmatimonadaceae bacterium]